MPSTHTRGPLLTATAIALVALLATGCTGNRQETMVSAHKLVSVTETDAVDLPGDFRAASIDTVTLWLGPGLARRDDARGTFLVDAHHDLLTFVDHTARSWTRETAATVERQFSLLSNDTLHIAGGRELHHLRELLDIKVRVSETDEYETIDGYHCRRWIVEQAFGTHLSTSELWLTTDIDADYTLLQRATRAALAGLPGGETALAEFARLEGVPVRSSSVLALLRRQTSTRTRLVAAEVVSLPLSFFAPPAAYAPTAENTE